MVFIVILKNKLKKKRTHNESFLIFNRHTHYLLGGGGGGVVVPFGFPHPHPMALSFSFIVIYL
jgi:hypothetical protein